MLTEKQKKAVLAKMESLENKAQDYISELKETCSGFAEGLQSKAGNKKVAKVLDKATNLQGKLVDTLNDIDDLIVDNYEYFLEEK